MHYEILVEDQSGKKALDNIVPKIIGSEHTFNVHSYKGVGRIPRGLKGVTDPNKRLLLDNLPRLLRGYGKTFAGYRDPPYSTAAVILVCDLDDKCLKSLRGELFNILERCNPRPKTAFCIAIEEGEAWFLGDLLAVKTAYPRAKNHILTSYINDSICGTWEKLADAIYPGGSVMLSSKGWQEIGAAKSVWAGGITPYMNVENNASPSFCYFRDKIRNMIDYEQ